MSDRTYDWSLYLVTDPRLTHDHGLAATVAEAVAAGVTAVQLRDPYGDEAAVLAAAEDLARALEDRPDVPLIVNDRVDLVARLGRVGVQGAHVGQGDLDPRRARDLLGPDRVLGLSAQTLAHVDAANALPAGTVDYLGVGPVWEQQTKPDAAPAHGPEGLAALIAATDLPCVAIGGINAGRIAEVRRAGAAGAAVVSAICGQADVTAATRALRRNWDEAAGAAR